MTKGVLRSISGIILAGGQSRRMGVDKASLPWGDSTVLDFQLNVLQTVCSQVIVVSNVARDGNQAVRIVPDNYPGHGPLGGLEAGLSAADNQLCFVAACDMPFLEAGSVTYLARCIEESQAAVPCIGGRWHPLYAVYKKTCLPTIRSLLSQGRLRMGDLVASLQVRAVSEEELTQFSPDLRMLNNINTPQDWQELAEKESKA